MKRMRIWLAIAGMTSVLTTSSGASAAVDARIAPTLAEAARASLTTTGFVHFSAGSWKAREQLVARSGLDVLTRLRSIDALTVRGPAAAITGLASHPWVRYLDGDQPLRYFGSTAVWATRVGAVRNAAAGGPYRDGSGNVLNGNGIGVGIIDSGVDARHPDLVSRVVTNYKVVIDTDLGPNSSSDSTSGHGTHVSGIVAGDGTASQGTFTGVAPGSKLHVFSAGEGLNVLFASTAFDMIYTDYASFTPAIRIVNNSWGNSAGTAYNPNGTIEKIVKKLVQDRGVVVVFAAGNDGGTGSVDSTSGYCKDPTPGVICAANYDDDESGNRDFALDSTSSRGRNGLTNTYPDVSAPGSFVTSTFRPTSGALYGSYIFPDPGWQPNYGDAGGTSMAAPHIAGIAALLLQAKPALTPADVEDVLLDSAHKFTAGGPYIADPQNAGQTTSFDKGAGLVDAVAALEDSRVGVTGDNAASPTLLASGDGGDYALFGAVDIVSASAVASATGITFSIEVADAGDRPPANVGLRVLANFDGRARRATVNLRPDGTVAPTAAEAPDDPATAEASSVNIAGNVVSFFVDYAELGDPAPGSPVHNIFFGSYVGVLQDLAPSPATAPPPSAGDLLARPLFTAPITTGN